MLSVSGEAELAALEGQLRSVNGHLWNVEDELRAHEARLDFGVAFVELARQVYKTNDCLAALKKQINLLCNSAIVEEKSYFSKQRGLMPDEMPRRGLGPLQGP